MRVSTILALAILAFAALLQSATPARADFGDWNLPGKSPHLLAHYMPWFTVEKSASDPSRNWNHWKWEGKSGKHDPEKRGADGKRDIASVSYPLIGPYRSWSRAVLRYHLETAHAAGIQGFLVDWNGPGTDTDSNIPLLLDEAQKAGMKIGICYEEKSNFVWPDHRNPKNRKEAVDGALGDLRYILTHYAVHSAYLRRNGHPFIFQFNGWGQGPIGPRYLTSEEWQEVMTRLPEKISYGRQGLDPAYSTSADCRYLWWSFNPGEVVDFNGKARRLIEDGKASFFMTMICPGFDDTGVWGWGSTPRVTPREGLSLLRATFDHALTGDPELVQIVTWNDFNEGTVIEPTRETGFQNLDAIANWWAARTGQKPDLDALRKPFLNYVRTCSPAERAELPESPYDDLLKRRPLTVAVPDYLDVLAKTK